MAAVNQQYAAAMGPGAGPGGAPKPASAAAAVGAAGAPPSRFTVDPGAGTAAGPPAGNADGTGAGMGDIDARLQQLQAFLQAAKTGGPLPPV